MFCEMNRTKDFLCFLYYFSLVLMFFFTFCCLYFIFWSMSCFYFSSILVHAPSFVILFSCKCYGNYGVTLSFLYFFFYIHECWEVNLHLFPMNSIAHNKVMTLMSKPFNPISNIHVALTTPRNLHFDYNPCEHHALVLG